MSWHKGGEKNPDEISLDEDALSFLHRQVQDSQHPSSSIPSTIPSSSFQSLPPPSFPHHHSQYVPQRQQHHHQQQYQQHHHHQQYQPQQPFKRRELDLNVPERREKIPVNKEMFERAVKRNAFQIKEEGGYASLSLILQRVLHHFSLDRLTDVIPG